MRAKTSWNCASQIICKTSTKEEYGEYNEYNTVKCCFTFVLWAWAL